VPPPPFPFVQFASVRHSTQAPPCASQYGTPPPQFASLTHPTQTPRLGEQCGVTGGHVVSLVHASAHRFVAALHVRPWGQLPAPTHWTHWNVAVLQYGLSPPQSALVVHWTHWLFGPHCRPPQLFGPRHCTQTPLRQYGSGCAQSPSVAQVRTGVPFGEIATEPGMGASPPPHAVAEKIPMRIEV